VADLHCVDRALSDCRHARCLGFEWLNLRKPCRHRFVQNSYRVTHPVTFAETVLWRPLPALIEVQRKLAAAASSCSAQLDFSCALGLTSLHPAGTSKRLASIFSEEKPPIVVFDSISTFAAAPCAC
jgi:hypothetical protein